ncbi:ADIPOR-like receptor [Colletotrichum sp. SAR 10_75]|nr:ADIPOR-like receptor [Colletotrichum sp. SAR 10_75]
MAALLSTSALRRRLQKAFGGESAGRRLRSWGGQAEAPEKQTKRNGSMNTLRQVIEKHASQSGSVFIAGLMFTMKQRTVNIYSHIIGAILFTFLPLLIFGDAISPRWTTASTSDIVVCSIYALGVTVCFVLSTAFHTFMSHSEPYYLAGIKADFHGVLALMWSSTAPLAHYTFPCSPRTRDAYVLLTGTLAALCAAATTRPNLGAVHLGHHRAALFATFGAAAFVLPIGHGSCRSARSTTSSAPNPLTISAFFPEHTATTTPSGPTASLAICTAKLPTPPLAPLTNTLLPFFSPAARTVVSAVHPAVNTLPAPFSPTPRGTATAYLAGRTTCSASAPVPVAQPKETGMNAATRSPLRNLAFAADEEADGVQTSATTPLRSISGTAVFALAAAGIMLT